MIAVRTPTPHTARLKARNGHQACEAHGATSFMPPANVKWEARTCSTVGQAHGYSQAHGDAIPRATPCQVSMLHPAELCQPKAISVKTTRSQSVINAPSAKPQAARWVTPSRGRTARRACRSRWRAKIPDHACHAERAPPGSRRQIAPTSQRANAAGPLQSCHAAASPMMTALINSGTSTSQRKNQKGFTGSCPK